MDPDSIDITADLTDGSDAALADTLVPSHGTDVVQQGAEGAKQAKPDGVISANEAPKRGEQEFSLRDQLSSAFKGEDTPASDATKSITSANTEVPALTQGADGKWRTPDGLFASNEQVEAFQAAQIAAKPVDTNAQQQAPAFLSRMTPVEREQYNALPAETREFLGRTMEAVEGQATRFGEYGLLEQQLIGPRREAWAANGMTPAVALNQLFALSDFASRSPKDFVLWFADQNKIDLDAALDERDQMQVSDPHIRALQGQVQQLQQFVTQTTQGHVQAQQQANEQEVQTWATEQDGAGKLKRPYLTDVMTTWPAHIQAIRSANPTMANAEVLQKAYDAACWSDPNVRAKMQEEVRAQALSEAQQRANAARVAGSSVNGAPSGAVPNAGTQHENLDLRQTLQAAFREHA